MADGLGTTPPPPPAPPAPPPPSDGDTFPMVFDSGATMMVPSARVNDAFKAGGKLAQPMRMPDGSTQLIPFDKVHDQMAKGATFMPSGTPGTVPKPQPPQMQQMTGLTSGPQLPPVAATAINPAESIRQLGLKAMPWLQMHAQQHREAAQREQNLAVGPESQNLSPAERAVHDLASLGHEGEAMTSGVVGGMLTDPKAQAAMAAGMADPAIPAAYFASQGFGGATGIGTGRPSSIKQAIQKPTPENVQQALGDLSMAAGGEGVSRAGAPIESGFEMPSYAEPWRIARKQAPAPEAAPEAAAAPSAQPPVYTKGETPNEPQRTIEQADPREQQRAAAAAAQPGAADTGRAEGPSYAYTRRSGEDAGGVRSALGVPVLESWSLDPETAATLQSRGFQSPDLHELDYNHPDAAQVFHDQIAQTKVGNPYAASVHVYTPEEYAQARMFLSEDGKAGFALRPDGDIISVFTHGDGPKGAVHTMLEIAKQAGGTKLDAFDTVLPGIYGRHGFTAVARLPWNDEFAPEGWDKNTFAKFNNGEPDVVFMARNPDAVPYEAGDGQRVGDYDEGVRLQQEFGAQQTPEDPEALRVSTRNPTAPGRTEDPLTQDLQINRQAIRDSPPGKGDVPVEDKMAERVSDYTGQKLSGTPAQILNAFQKHIVDNLVWLHNQLPEDFRGRAKLWYDSANKLAADWGEKYNLTTQQVAGIIAALSPQKDWNMNVSLARRMIEGYQQHQDTPYSPAMEATSKDLASTASLRPYLKAIKGKTLSQLSDPIEKAMWIRLHDEAENPQSYEIYAPEGGTTGLARNQMRKGQTLGDPSKLIWHSNPNLAKALSIIEDGSRENISDQLGDMHKVRNFYNNIVAPNSKAGDVTIDTHAVAAALLRPLAALDPEVKHNFGGSLAPGKNPMYPDGVPGAGGSKVSGVNGTYGLYADAYRAAAQKLGLLPRELQSITWEGIRSLFPSEYKKIEANKAIIDGIWSDYANGKIPTINQARKQVFNAAGRFKPAEWETPVGGVNETIPAAGVNETTRTAARPEDVSGGRLYGQAAGATRPGGGSRTPARVQGRVPRELVAAPPPVPPIFKQVSRR